MAIKGFVRGGATSFKRKYDRNNDFLDELYNGKSKTSTVLTPKLIIPIQTTIKMKLAIQEQITITMQAMKLAILEQVEIITLETLVVVIITLETLVAQESVEIPAVAMVEILVAQVKVAQVKVEIPIVEIQERMVQAILAIQEPVDISAVTQYLGVALQNVNGLTL